jgi:hybrid polyketide synthase/nonribosomal peptide synthetase ACE1
LNGNLKVDKLAQALELVAMRHEFLRTFFDNDVSQPDMAVQSVSDTNYAKLEHRTINHVDEAAQEYEQPSVDWIVSLLAIWRIGCIYIPLDVANPLTRLAAIVETCQPSVILTDATTSPNANSLCAGNALTLNVSNVPAYASALVPDLSRRAQAAVIIYTSGSTGTPKGITVNHECLRNYIEGSIRMYDMETPQTTLQQSTLSFDISLEQIFTGLATGGSVFMCPLNQRGDPLEITKVMRDENITYSQAIPSEYLMWLQYGMSTLRQCTHWKYAIAGGERLTNTVAKQFAALDLFDMRLINSYGPAEISCGSSFHEIE